MAARAEQSTHIGPRALLILIIHKVTKRDLYPPSARSFSYLHPKSHWILRKNDGDGSCFSASVILLLLLLINT